MAINVKPMEPMEVEAEDKEQNISINPFCQDAFNMGEQIGTNVTVMFGNHDHEHCDYLIVVNTKTGERIRITF